MRFLIPISLVLLLPTRAYGDIDRDIDRDALVSAIVWSAPHEVSKPTAAEHVDAAIAATDGTTIDPVLLLAMAYYESRYTMDAVSRLVCHRHVCHRQTGTWPSRKPGKGFAGPYFCGPIQLKARTWKACLKLRDDDLVTAYTRVVKQLEEWLAATRNDLTRALTGYCGGFALLQQHSYRCARARLGRAHRLRRLMATAQINDV